MDIDFIKLEDLRVRPNWVQSPIGEILAVTLAKPGKGVEDADCLIVLRCIVQQAGLQDHDWVICLDGDRKGKLLSTHDLAAGPAFMVTDLVEIGVKEPLGWVHPSAGTHFGLVFAREGELVLKGEVSSGLQSYCHLSPGNRGMAVEQMVYPAVCLGEISVRWKGEAKPA